MSRILIVEDNERNLKLVRDLLQGNGFETLDARTAEEGIELAISCIPDLVLMDIRLPGMDGFEALKALRSNDTTRSIPVVAVTASVMSNEVDRITHAGFDGYIPKPIRYASFLAAVRGVLERVRA